MNARSLAGTPLLAVLLLVAQACAAPLAAQDDIADVFERVQSSVVTLRTLSLSPTVQSQGIAVAQEGVGSGVLVSEDGRILTASHVVQMAEQIVVEFHDGRSAPARTISSDPLSDLALVQLDGPLPADVAPAELGDSDAARIGSEVFVVGAPLGISHTLTVGHLSARRMTPSLTDASQRVEVLQTDAAINPGNSGGPLFDLDGRVIGVVSFINSRTGGNEGLGFAVAINTCRLRLLERAPVWSGLEFISLDGRSAELFNLPPGARGILVQRVVRGGLTDRLGIRGGDVPAEIDGTPLLLGGDIILAVDGMGLSEDDARDSIRTRLQTKAPDQDLTVTLLRGGQLVELTARWGDLQPDAHGGP